MVGRCEHITYGFAACRAMITPYASRTVAPFLCMAGDSLLLKNAMVSSEPSSFCWARNDPMTCVRVDDKLLCRVEFRELDLLYQVITYPVHCCGVRRCPFEWNVLLINEVAKRNHSLGEMVYLFLRN